MLRFIEKNGIQIKYYKKPIIKMRLGGATSKNFKNILKQNLEIINAFKKNKIYVNPILYFLKRMFNKLSQYSINK